MKENKKLFLGDLVIILFLIYAYLWRIEPLFSMRRIGTSLYLLLISVIFYLFIYKVLKINHWGALLGTLVFSFCGSDPTLIFYINKMPYPGTLSLFIGCFSFCAIEKKKCLLFYVSALILFVLAALSIFMRLPLILVSSIRLFFNLLMGIIVTYGFNVIQNPSYDEETIHCYKRVQRLLYGIWLCTLLFFLPVSYALLVLFIEISKQLIPSVVNYLVIFEILLGWTLVISHKENKRISDIVLPVTIFLLVADIFTYWVAK